MTEALQRLGRPYEILFVDDGSRDGSFERIEKLRLEDPCVRGVQLRRNFGKAAALAVGFREARGDVIITMDADLQDDPAEVPKLLARLEDGFDLVSGWKQDRQDPRSKTWPSQLFNWVTGFLTGVRLHDFNSGFKIYRREVVEEIRLYGELHRFIPALAAWRGFQVTEVPVHHRPRRYGRTKFGSTRLWRGFLDLLTVLFLTRYTRRPLHLFGGLGLIAWTVGFVVNAYLTGIWLSGSQADRAAAAPGLRRAHHAGRCAVLRHRPPERAGAELPDAERRRCLDPASTGLIAGARRSDNEAKYRSRNPVVRHLLGRFLGQVSELAASERPRRILEVGCGEGIVLATLAARVPGARLDGLELDETALEEARKRCPGAALVRGDACALPFRNQSFDLVVCLEVLEHLPEPGPRAPGAPAGHPGRMPPQRAA